MLMRCVRRGVSFVAFLHKNLACLMGLGLIMFCVEMHSRGDNVWRGGLMMNSVEIALGRSPTRTHTTQQTFSQHTVWRAARARPAVSLSVSLISRDAVLSGRRPKAVPFGGRGGDSGNCRN